MPSQLVVVVLLLLEILELVHLVQVRVVLLGVGRLQHLLASLVLVVQLQEPTADIHATETLLLAVALALPTQIRAVLES
jgi:hypothetical protein